MTVAEMLSRISSYELTEWRAYELAFGPLDSSYRDEIAASSHEMLQAMRHTMGQLWATDGDNPVSEPQQLPRPHALYRNPDDEDDEDEGMSFAEFDRLNFRDE